MQKISCYVANDEELAKNFCLLAEKCYYNKLHVLAIITDHELLSTLDNKLWTYSVQHFIPHATHKDPLPELQPVYLTDKLENPNKSEVALFINSSNDEVLEAFSDQKKLNLQDFSKIMFLSTNGVGITPLRLSELIATSKFSSWNVEFFKQTPRGNWQRE